MELALELVFVLIGVILVCMNIRTKTGGNFSNHPIKRKKKEDKKKS